MGHLSLQDVDLKPTRRCALTSNWRIMGLGHGINLECRLRPVAARSVCWCVGVGVTLQVEKSKILTRWEKKSCDEIKSNENKQFWMLVYGKRSFPRREGVLTLCFACGWRRGESGWSMWRLRDDHLDWWWIGFRGRSISKHIYPCPTPVIFYCSCKRILIPRYTPFRVLSE